MCTSKQGFGNWWKSCENWAACNKRGLLCFRRNSYENDLLEIQNFSGQRWYLPNAWVGRLQSLGTLCGHSTFAFMLSSWVLEITLLNTVNLFLYLANCGPWESAWFPQRPYLFLVLLKVHWLRQPTIGTLSISVSKTCRRKSEQNSCGKLPKPLHYLYFGMTDTQQSDFVVMNWPQELLTFNNSIFHNDDLCADKRIKQLSRVTHNNHICMPDLWEPPEICKCNPFTSNKVLEVHPFFMKVFFALVSCLR